MLIKPQDTYHAFTIVTRIWRYISTNKRLGQLHNINRAFPHRPRGSLALLCPACPEPGVNMKIEFELGQEYLRCKHINYIVIRYSSCSL
jgi:hypothetical protein